MDYFVCVCGQEKICLEREKVLRRKINEDKQLPVKEAGELIYLAGVGGCIEIDLGGGEEI